MDGDEASNGRVTMALLKRDLDAVCSELGQVKDQLKTLNENISKHNETVIRNEERIRGLSSRTAVTDGLNFIAAIIAAALFGRQ